MSPQSRRPLAPLDLAAERDFLGATIEEAVLSVVRSGQYVLGPEVARFEQDFAALCGAAHGVGVASGTDALVVALRALGVGPGTSVVTSPFTFFASAGTVLWCGARPIFADVDPDTALLDPERAADAIEDDTRCLLPVHLYGQMADVTRFRELADERGLALLEDAAQAHGATRDGHGPGALGDAAAFSFYPTKNLGAAGEAGLVVTRDDAVADRLRQLRDHGSPRKYEHETLGTNSRMHALQGAVLNVKLPHLADWVARRAEIAARYDAAFADLAGVRPLARVPDATHAWHQYTVRVDEDGIGRDALQAALADEGIHAAVHYPRPAHLQAALGELGYGPGDFPEAERLAREVLCLPVHPFLADADVDRIAEAVVRISAR
jgi:dTDP-4-amino-4,6-dideoxygalactose transaminase